MRRHFAHLPRFCDNLYVHSLIFHTTLYTSSVIYTPKLLKPLLADASGCVAADQSKVRGPETRGGRKLLDIPVWIDRRNLSIWDNV